ncbi:protamine-2 (modular protein) [Mesorhizobium sp. B1-1-8]|uniref:protamine-2 (modular protein) n=1 Tax=Mesorhizobium sp. B1-1-8 TaxID=2589976 RepID=UPI001128222B|nr:protamine-2 (modular protein) [Mesorhizobium sp. B1-1-8]UCI07449.1 protamine-2 (modular protein) [Mesorhizobium sp. B1-1-8]
MERRLFLTGMLGIAGAAAFASLAGTGKAAAGIPNGNGILDELDKPDPAIYEEDDQADPLQPVQYYRRRYYHDRYYRHRHYRHRYYRRRHVWRRVCRRYWRYGRRHVRCWRRRVWVGFWL